jgi:hypothetical protein
MAHLKQEHPKFSKTDCKVCLQDVVKGIALRILYML